MTDRLELTWPNKHRFLLSPRDSDGKPVWVERTHPGAVEVRGHEFTGEYGEVGADPYADNLLITGDSYDALRMLCEVPEFRRHYRGKVKLVYIDPPFNTGQTFAQYDDWLDHSTWLSMMRSRLVLIRELLAPDGSVWVHLDDSEQHRARVVLDEVFGAENFITTVVWQKRYSRENRVVFGSVHDTIHVYAKTGSRWRDSRNLLPRGGDKAYRNPDNDPLGPWRVIPLTVNGVHKNQLFDIVGPDGSIHRPPKGRSWSCIESTYTRYVAEGRVIFGRTGKGAPGLKAYLSDMPGLTPWSWWPHEDVGHTDEAKKEILALFPDADPFDTPKPERLLERIVHVASNEGDIVLDAFAGSGTTPAVAHKMRRRWLAVELNSATVLTFTRSRLDRVVNGQDPSGATSAVGWSGGGGFRTAAVLPPLYDLGPGDAVVLATDPADPRVPHSVAGQLGYEFALDQPFVGRRGRMRLAYVPGAVGPDDVVGLAGALSSYERLTVVAMAVLPGAEAALSEASPGSRVLKLPRDVLAARRRRGDA